MKLYRVFDHTADLGIEIFGETRKALFIHAAFAVFDLMTDLHSVQPQESRRISVEGADREDLLINYLREVLSLFNGEKLLLKEFSIDEINDRHLTGEVQGEVFDPARHPLMREIKAVTYHRAEVRETGHGWQGKVIFDV